MSAQGHGGGDEVLTSARTSLESHLMCFAAEKSRLEGCIVDMAEYTRQVEAEVAAEDNRA